VAKKKLDLLKIAARLAAKLRARTAKIVRTESLNAQFAPLTCCTTNQTA
jgi:hypothetical protein